MAKKRQAVVIDLDNTLALLNGKRSPYDGHLCASDELCAATHTIIRGLLQLPHITIFFLTGRHEKARAATEYWLNWNVMMRPNLLMRAADDDRPSDEFKLAMLDRYVLPTYEIVFAIDDDPKVVRAFRERGIVCLHVRDWEEHAP